MATNYSTYSLPDTHTVFSHPDVGSIVLSEEDAGGGRIVFGYSGDMSSHTNTANGYTVINKLHYHNGTVSIEVAQNSPADLFLQRYANYVASAATNRFALATITLFDSASGIQMDASGVTLQKRPDRQYDQTSGSLTYAFLCADMALNV